MGSSEMSEELKSPDYVRKPMDREDEYKKPDNEEVKGEVEFVFQNTRDP